MSVANDLYWSNPATRISARRACASPFGRRDLNSVRRHWPLLDSFVYATRRVLPTNLSLRPSSDLFCWINNPYFVEGTVATKIILEKIFNKITAKIFPISCLFAQKNINKYNSRTCHHLIPQFGSTIFIRILKFSINFNRDRKARVILPAVTIHHVRYLLGRYLSLKLTVAVTWPALDLPLAETITDGSKSKDQCQNLGDMRACVSDGVTANQWSKSADNFYWGCVKRDKQKN